jgi:hypothetical protein
MRRTSKTENERKRKQRENRKRERNIQLAEANILVVIPKTRNFKFNMPLNPTGKCKEANGNVPKRFEQWMKKGENNFDALLKSAAGRGEPLFEFKESKPGLEEREPELQGPIGLWAFWLREMLGKSDNLTKKNSSLRFTTSNTFYENVMKRPEEQADRIADKYQYIMLS